jgi:3-methyl-2-oxobutanoate hydroxymethyltransferase
MSVHAQQGRLSLRQIQAMYRAGEKLTMLTAYDYVTAGLLDRAGIEMILVGDSLGNVVLGYDTTLPVSLDDMCRHTAAVVRGTARASVICDLPFGSTTDPETALKASIRAMKETGCQAVKLEGGSRAALTVRRLTEQGIPVVGHIGLTPQSIHQLGGYYRHGKTEAEVLALEASAMDLQEAGAFSVVLECVIPEAAARITRKLSIPTIGIGSGNQCSGQVLVINDLIGLGLKPGPKFAHPRADVASVIQAAAADFLRETKGRNEEERCETGLSLTLETRTQ